ncbi:MAG: hypothetical protein K0S28_2194, partial [Paucimonas sp.]|nr:hypothetical protein [Paucimonas sp.]
MQSQSKRRFPTETLTGYAAGMIRRIGPEHQPSLQAESGLRCVAVTINV